MQHIKTVFAGIGAFLGVFLGGFDGFMYALLFCIIIDYCTGIMVAIIQKKLSSEIGFQGLFKKMSILMLIGIAHLIDAYVIGNAGVLRTAVIFFYISNEGISILENVILLGLSVPDKLKDILIQIKGDNT